MRHPDDKRGQMVQQMKSSQGRREAASFDKNKPLGAAQGGHVTTRLAESRPWAGG